MEENFRVEALPESQQRDSCIDAWKIARIGFLLSKVKTELTLNQLMIIMFLSFFKYADSGFMEFNCVIGGRKETFIKRELGILTKLNFVEKLDLNIDKIVDDVPSIVYRNATSGRALARKIWDSLDNTSEFFDFEY